MDYLLFFATNNEQGLRKMKEAMWRVDESGTYSFSDATNPAQTVLFSSEPDRQLLARLITGKFSGAEVTLGEVESFVVRDTAFRETHYKKVLQALEQANRVVVTNAPSNRRRGTYPNADLEVLFQNTLA